LRHPIRLAGLDLLADASGALWWQEERALIVADLHLEKGSSFAARGILLPPYDTGATLALLAAIVARYAPRITIALGDSFHDARGPARLSPADCDTIGALARVTDLMWVAGNHDPAPNGLFGQPAQMLALGPLLLRHEPSDTAAEGEVCGHLHPVASVSLRGRNVRRRCFVSDGHRLVMPAFGAYAGGLNVRHHAFCGILARDFTAHLIGESGLYAIEGSRCRPD
jgi:DNA ligase-associated metallophosphoesterase